jgi:hypothetical protein
VKSALFPVLAAGFLLFSLAVSAKAALEPERGLLDFGAFYMAGVAQERGFEPYGVYPELAAETGADFGHEDGRGHSPNLNPPISLYPFRLLAGADPGDVKMALNALSAAVFAACAFAMARAYPQHRTIFGFLWIAAFGGFWYTLWLGQVYVLLFALGLAAWLLIQRGTHPIIAGELIGLLVAVKPHLVLWPLFLLLAGHPRVGLASFGVTAAVSAIPLALEGPGIYVQWLEAVQAYPRIGIGSNASIVGQAERFGLIEAGYALSAVLIVAAAFVIWRSRASAVRASGWGIVVALLATPVAWIGYGLLAMPVLLSRRWAPLEWVAATGMTGLWFVLGRGDVALAASLVLLYLLVKDQLVRRQLGRSVTEALALNARRERTAA